MKSGETTKGKAKKHCFYIFEDGALKGIRKGEYL